MMNFWMLVGAIVMANVIWTLLAFALASSKMFQKWYMNYTKKLGEQIVDMFEED